MNNTEVNDAKRKLKNEELDYQLKKFEQHRKLPAIVAIVILLLAFIWGIVDPCIFSDGSYHGIMSLPNGFLCWLVWMLIGGVNAFIDYELLTILYSYRLLHIYYLQRFVGDETILEDVDEDGEEFAFEKSSLKSEESNSEKQDDNQEENV